MINSQAYATGYHGHGYGGRVGNCTEIDGVLWPVWPHMVRKPGPAMISISCAPQFRGMTWAEYVTHCRALKA